MKTSSAPPSVSTLEPTEQQIDSAIDAIHIEISDLRDQLPHLRESAARGYLFRKPPDASLEDALRRIAYLEEIIPSLETLKAIASDRRLTAEIELLSAPIGALEAKEKRLADEAAAIDRRASVLTAQAFENAIGAREVARLQLFTARTRLKETLKRRSDLRETYRAVFDSMERDGVRLV